jgi:hypothetical protein
MYRRRTKIIQIIVLTLILGGYGIYYFSTRVPTTYEEYDKNILPYSCDLADTQIIDDFDDYVTLLNNCEIEGTKDEVFFDNNFVVMTQEFTSNRNFKNPNVNRNLFDEGTTITIRLGEPRVVSEFSGYRIYEFAFSEDDVKKETISVRVTRERD